MLTFPLVLFELEGLSMAETAASALPAAAPVEGKDGCEAGHLYTQG